MYELPKPKKDIHVCLDSDVYTQIKLIVLQKNTNLTEIFAEFAELVVKGNNRALKIIDNMLTRKAVEKINAERELYEKTHPKTKKKKNKSNFSVQDQDTIYNLIEASKTSNKHNDDEDDG